MESEIAEPVRTYLSEHWLNADVSRPVWQVLEALGIRDPKSVNDQYCWRRPPSFVPEAVVTIWSEFVEIDRQGRWYCEESLDWGRLRFGQDRGPLQKPRARARVEMLQELSRNRKPFIALLQVNERSKEELQRGIDSSPKSRVRDEQHWCVVELIEPQDGSPGRVVLVRGDQPGQPDREPQPAAPYAHLLAGEEFTARMARAALPVLVRQARAAQTVSYKDLARELGIPFQLNLNTVLGLVGRALKAIEEGEHIHVPPIQALVVQHGDDGLPGDGIDLGLATAFRTLPRDQQRMVIRSYLADIFTFGRWTDVLALLGLRPLEEPFAGEIRRASSRGAEEGVEHRALKEFVRTHPELVGFRGPVGRSEAWLPSGDRLDVELDNGSEWVAVEVKPSTSGETDLTRGLFQCVKYQAVMEAVAVCEPRERNVRAVLVLGGALPPKLVALRNRLGVHVLENIRPT